MKLRRIDIFQFRLPLTRPIRLNNETRSVREGILIRVTSESGTTGWGEISPLPGFSIETLREARAQTEEFAAQPGASLSDAASSTLPSVRFGFELASESLLLRHIPRHRFGSPGTRIALCGLLTGSRQQMIAEASRIKAIGYRAVKVKVGGRSVADEVELVKELAARIAGVKFRLDANGTWELAEAEEFLSGLKGVNVDYIEEPVADRHDLRYLARNCDVPIALDETLRIPEARAFVPFAQVLVLKPSLIGELRSLVEFADTAVGNGKRCIVSAAWETGIGVNALLRLASSLPGEIHGLDTYRYLRQDILHHPLRLAVPVVRCPEKVPSDDDVNMSLLEHV